MLARFLKIMLLVISLGLLGATAAEAQTPTVNLDGKALIFDVPPVIENSRTLVPLRVIFEALGAKVDWDEKSQSVTATKGELTIKLMVGSHSALIGQSIVTLDVPSKIIRNRTMVPLRFVSESLGAKVTWNEAEQKVEIESGSQNTTEPSGTTGSNYWETLKNFKMDPNPTGTSQSVVYGDFSSEVRWVWLKIIKGTAEKDWVVGTDGGSFSQKIYLPFGQGDYQIKILATNSAEKNATYYSAKEVSIVNNDTTNHDYLLPSEYVQSDDPQIIELATKITKGLSSDRERSKAIHDWVATNIAYDTEAYFSGTSGMYSALDTLRLKKAVCNGYANLNAALHRAVGLKVKIISGSTIQLSRGETWASIDKTKSNHAWNEVYVDGKWIIEDTTWDAGNVDFDTQKFTFSLKDKYFNPDPETFAKDHYKIEELDD